MSFSKVESQRVLVRFEVRVDGGDPPVGPKVRYYELKRVLDTWQVKRERGQWSWYLRVF